MEFTEIDCDLLGEALLCLLAEKQKAFKSAQNCGLKFVASDFGIPQIETLIARIESAA